MDNVIIWLMQSNFKGQPLNVIMDNVIIWLIQSNLKGPINLTDCSKGKCLNNMEILEIRLVK